MYNKLSLYPQDALDLFLGKYVIVEGEGNTALCPLRRPRDWKYLTVSLLAYHLPNC